MSKVRNSKSQCSKRSGISDITISFCTEEKTKALLSKLATGEAIICGGSMFTDEENETLLRAALGVK